MKAAREGERQDLKANEKSSICLYMILVMNAKTTLHRNQEDLLSKASPKVSPLLQSCDSPLLRDAT
jgi:hypothetical protein